MKRYMMATAASHMLGDVSREQDDVCVIMSEDPFYYIGQWATGLGLVGVQFPRSSTRELTDLERQTIAGLTTKTVKHFGASYPH